MPFVVSFANLPGRDDGARAPGRCPTPHWLESWGDYAPREGVVGLMQPTMGPVQRRARPWATCCSPSGAPSLGTEEGKGPLPWASFEQYREGGVGAGREGPAGTAALPRGGVVARDVAPAAVHGRRSSASTRARRSSRATATGLALLAIPRSASTTAAAPTRAWLQEAPDTMTQVAWDAWVEIPAETAKSSGSRQGDVVKRDVAARRDRAARVPVGRRSIPRRWRCPMGHRYAPYHVRRQYVAAPPPARRTRWRCCRRARGGLRRPAVPRR